MNILDCPEDIIKQIFVHLIEPLIPATKGARHLVDEPEISNPFEKIVENSIPIFLQCRLVSKAFQKKADQLNPNRFIGLLPSLRKKMLNFNDIEAIREPGTSALWGTLVKWVSIQEQRAVVPFVIDKIFKTAEDRKSAKNIFSSTVYIELGPNKQFIGIHIPNNNSSYVILQSDYVYLNDDKMGCSMDAAIIDYKNEPTREVRSNKELYDDFTQNYEEYKNKFSHLANNNGRRGLYGILQISKKTINTLVTALGAPQWSLVHEFEADGDYEAQEHEYCFSRFVLSLFTYHKLALGYYNDEIDVSLDLGVSRRWNTSKNKSFSVIDDRIDEILPNGKTPSLAQLTHELKNMIAAYQVTFESLERATLFHEQLHSALEIYWLMTINRIKSQNRFITITKYMEKIAPGFNLEKLTDLFANKIEWFKLERHFADKIKLQHAIFGRLTTCSYSITFNESQMVIFKIDIFEHSTQARGSMMIRGVGLKSLEGKAKETITLLTYELASKGVFKPSISNTDVIQELRALMQFPEDLPDLHTIDFFVKLAAKCSEASQHDFMKPHSTEGFFLSNYLDKEAKYQLRWSGFIGRTPNSKLRRQLESYRIVKGLSDDEPDPDSSSEDEDAQM